MRTIVFVLLCVTGLSSGADVYTVYFPFWQLCTLASTHECFPVNLERFAPEHPVAGMDKELFEGGGILDPARRSFEAQALEEIDRTARKEYGFHLVTTPMSREHRTSYLLDMEQWKNLQYGFRK